MLVLGIETSCDETSAAIVENGKNVLSNIISTQIDIHRLYGGVVPEIASRQHLELIVPVIEAALAEAHISYHDVDLVAVTCGPGLVGALLVGVAAAKAVSFAVDKPLVGVNHLHGHICANYIENDIEFPALCLVVSGGHTSLIRLEGPLRMEILGQTRDDAAGEAFDKISRVLGLGYPGGPAIEKYSKDGDPLAYILPRTMHRDKSYDFSFSGIKTAIINTVHNAEQRGEVLHVPSLAASFQKNVVDTLVSKTVKAALDIGVRNVMLAGGVAANSYLKERLTQELLLHDMMLYCPSLLLCTDNAAMIAVAGYYGYQAGQRSGLDLNAYAVMPLESI